MTVDIDQRPPKRSRYIFPALIASLALNLLLIGGFVAGAWHHRHGGPRPHGPGLLDFVRELPPERQDVVRREISSARESMKDLREALRKSWVDANSLLAAEPFDKEKLKAALTSLADAEAKYKAALYGALADTAEKLSPEERKLLQAWRDKRRPHLLIRSGEPPRDEAKPD